MGIVNKPETKPVNYQLGLLVYAYDETTAEEKLTELLEIEQLTLVYTGVIERCEEKEDANWWSASLTVVDLKGRSESALSHDLEEQGDVRVTSVEKSTTLLPGTLNYAASGVVAQPRITTLKPIKTQFYRSGLMTKSVDYGPAQNSFAFGDQFCPPGRVGRLEGLFCSVDIADMAVWYRSNLMCKYDSQPTEINYTGPEPWVYDVTLWGSAYDSELQTKDGQVAFQQKCERYWASGMPFSEFMQSREELTKKYPHKRWEVLLDAKHVTSSRNVAKQRVLEQADSSTRRELGHQLFPKRTIHR